MKKLTAALSLMALLSFTPDAEAAKGPELTYSVNLNDCADDRFKVALEVKGLSPDNNIFQFAATAPGAVLRDGKGIEIACTLQEKEKIQHHQFEVNKHAPPEQVALRYSWLRNM